MELTEIQAALSCVEQEKNIRILYAAESGTSIGALGVGAIADMRIEIHKDLGERI